jgi:sugar O-acyltransferase (sialic acid O-acetyltransferase NeuD family)
MSTKADVKGIAGNVILHGGGDHARVVLDCLLGQGIKVLGIFDPKFNGELYGIPQLGKYNPLIYPEAQVVIAIGDNAIRKKVAESITNDFINVVHSTAVISPFSSMGIGNMILHRSIIQASAQISNHVIINTGTQIDHDCIIENYAHVGPGAILCGTVFAGEGCFIGAGAIVIPGCKIGKWATVGAGTVVTKDIPDYGVAVGNPSRIVRIKKSL